MICYESFPELRQKPLTITACASQTKDSYTAASSLAGRDAFRPDQVAVLLLRTYRSSLLPLRFSGPRNRLHLQVKDAEAADDWAYEPHEGAPQPQRLARTDSLLIG